MVNKVTFAGFRGSDRPRSGSAPASKHLSHSAWLAILTCYFSGVFVCISGFRLLFGWMLFLVESLSSPGVLNRFKHVALSPLYPPFSKVRGGSVPIIPRPLHPWRFHDMTLRDKVRDKPFLFWIERSQLPCSTICPECPGKDWRSKPCWLHPRESGQLFAQGPGGVNISLTLLGPVLVWSHAEKQNQLRLLLTVKYFESS